MHYMRSAPRVVRYGSNVTRLAVALYWSLGVVFGLLRLSRADWSGAEIGQVVTAWYVEALLFLAAWGGAACLMGLLTGHAEPRRRRKRARIDPLRADTLAGLERQRGR